MIKIRVQCLPEHIGITKVSLEKNFKIHSSSPSYPQKNSDFVRVYIEASPIDAGSTIRVQSILDIFSMMNAKYHKDSQQQYLLLELKQEILKAIDPNYIHRGDRS